MTFRDLRFPIEPLRGAKGRPGHDRVLWCRHCDQWTVGATIAPAGGVTCTVCGLAVCRHGSSGPHTLGCDIGCTGPTPEQPEGLVRVSREAPIYRAAPA
jgi:hypothetical protein